MPLIVWGLVIAGSAIAGASVYNKIDDAIIDPITGAGNGSGLVSTGMILAATAGAAAALYAKKRGLI